MLASMSFLVSHVFKNLPLYLSFLIVSVWEYRYQDRTEYLGLLIRRSLRNIFELLAWGAY